MSAVICSDVQVKRAGTSANQRPEAEIVAAIQELPGMAGLWVSPAGSRYLSNGREFVCIGVGHAQFAGWIGKTAIASVESAGAFWTGKQAIRHKRTGCLSHWVPLSMSIDGDLLTKRFPPSVPGYLLVHGHIERYRRIRLIES